MQRFNNYLSVATLIGVPAKKMKNICRKASGVKRVYKSLQFSLHFAFTATTASLAFRPSRQLQLW